MAEDDGRNTVPGAAAEVSRDPSVSSTSEFVELSIVPRFILRP